MLHLILIKETTNYCSGHEGLGIMIRPIITGYYIIHLDFQPWEVLLHQLVTECLIFVRYY